MGRSLTLLVLGILACAAVLLPAQQEGGQGEVRKPPTALAPDQECRDCHQALYSGEVVHDPVREDMCDACHAQEDPAKHVFAPPPKDASSCLSCHDPQTGSDVHKPVAQGRCTSCHDPHHSPNRALLRRADEGELCGACHNQETGEGAAHVHGPVAAGMCTACHDPHATDTEKLLVQEGSDLCLGCHEDMAERLDEAENVHPPVEVDCALCHDPHASPFPSQLREKGKDLCLGCHEDITERLGSSVVHGAVTRDRECLNCHRPHHSAFPKMLDHAAEDLCLSCHDQSLEATDGRKLMDMAKKLEAEFKHGPIRDGNCSACHEPHGSEFISLLRRAYPKRFYSSWDPNNYALCFGCHDKNAFAERNSTLTGFRDGDENLHYVHVHREKKGRTCRACHDTHASDLPKHLEETSPFGKWQMPIQFEATAQGGSCSPGCHAKRSYQRKAVELPAPRSESATDLETNVSEGPER